nr:reverse transcriptase domain-containing protein [Tanacetum cinerariifolium]
MKHGFMKTTSRVTTVNIHNVSAARLKMKVTTVRVLSVVGLKPRLKCEGAKPTRQRSPVSTRVFTRLGDRDRNVFQRLGERKKTYTHVGQKSCRDADMQAKEKALAQAGRLETPTKEEKKREISSKVMLRVPVNVKEKSKENGGSKSPTQSVSREPLSPLIRNFEVPKRNRMPTNVETYDGTGDPKDHLNIFQTAAKIKRWAMPTWCHMFNSTLIGSAKVWFDKLPSEYIDSYEILRKAFLGNFSQQKKYIKELLEIHHIKQIEGEAMKAFIECFKMGNIFPQRRSSRCKPIKKKAPPAWKHSEASHKPSFEKMVDFKSRHESTSSDRRENPMVIEAKVKGRSIHRMYMDGGSASGILISSSFFIFLSSWIPYDLVCDGNDDPNRMTPATTLLLGFNEEISWSLGQISLAVTLGDSEHSTITTMNIMVVKSPSPYNGIIGRLRLRKIQAVPSTAYGMLKFLVNGGVVTLHSSTILSADMTGIPRSIAEHRLNIRKGCPPIRQKRRGHAPDRNKAIQEELVDKAFEKQIGRNLEVYVDDMVIKSHTEQEILKDIEETFKTLKRLNMKLNPKKPRTSIRGQVLADFITERPEEDGPPTNEEDEEMTQNPWTLFKDGSLIP